MAAQERPYQPPLPWRITSAVNIGVVGFLCRTFLYGLNNTQCHGLQHFLEILDSRKDEKSRTRGLVTVSNHVSVLDDPLIWGVLPFRYGWDPNNMRWSLGSYDICFKNGALSAFFSYGNTLPTHRAHHSKFGGLFQPTMTQAIRLLSDPHGQTGSGSRETSPINSEASQSAHSFASTDPFSTAELTYSTTGLDSVPAPAVYPSRRHSWVHIFPEGMIHQHPDKVMRYFKWGVARLILEAEPCPDVLPIWVDGPQHVMSNTRPWPRPLPRVGKDISVTFGDLVDTEKVFEPFRQKWKAMKQRAACNRSLAGSESADPANEAVGVVTDEDLRYGAEAEQLRIDVTLAVRNEVLKVRRMCGLPDEDPKRGLAETFRVEGEDPSEEGKKKDGSVVRDL
nr:lysophosphatidylcholine acyltransferase [Quercus suber]